MRLRRALPLCALVAACAAPKPPEAPSEAVIAAPTPAAPETPAAADLAPSIEPEAVPPVAATPPAPAGPRIASRRYITWIYNSPARKGLPIGYIRVGTAIHLKSADKVAGEGCGGGWYAAVPFGYVCHDDSTTLDPDHDPLIQAHAALSKLHYDRALPLRYAFSTGAPMYGKVPSPAEQDKVEGKKETRRPPEKLGKWSTGHEELADGELGEVSDVVPELLTDHQTLPTHYGEDKRVVRKWIPNGSMLAFTQAFRAEGRTWLLSADLTVVPADRVRPYRPSKFHGVRLDGEHAKIPAAWTRHDAKPLYDKAASGDGFTANGETPPRTFLALTGERVESGKKAYLGVEGGHFVDESDVVIVKPKEKRPVNVGDTQKWIEIHIRAGTLTAYVGDTPVYTTLVSPGAGGVGPYDGTNEQLVKLSTSPLGTYRVVWKDRSAAMSPEKGEPQKFWISDVPYTQYFRAPFALHVAYWHEDFGMPKSAGCVNISPEDGLFLFGWTDPQIPAEWQGVGPSKDHGWGTVIVVSP